MNRLKTIIVDDERLARRGLALRLQHFEQIEVVAQCVDGHEALKAIAEHAPDLMFLDIQMPGMDGFEVICQLQADTMPMVVFVTAFDQYAVEAFRVHALDYVLKPIDEERLGEAVARAIERQGQQESNRDKAKLVELMQARSGTSDDRQLVDSPEPGPQWPDRLTIKDGSKFRFVKVADIEWVDAAGDYMCVHARGETHIMRTTMKRLESTLNPETFLRVHRSSIANVNCIAGAQPLANGEYLLTLEGGAQLKVSRSCSARIKALFNV